MPKLDVILSGNIIIKNFDTFRPALLNRLLRLLTRANPEVTLNKRLGIMPPKEKKLFMYRFVTYIIKGIPQQVLELDRGCWRELVTIVKMQPGLEISITDNRVKSPLDTMPNFIGELDEFQKTALNSVGKKTQGTLILPTGGGKTVTSLALIAQLKHRTLILVNTIKLQNQWVDRISKFIPGARVGTIPGINTDDFEGAVKNCDIIVATLQTANIYITRSEQLKVLRANIGCILLDECHHVPAKTFRNVISRFPAYYRFGVTATRERRDGRTFYVDSSFGVPIIELGYKDVGDRIILPKIVPIRTSLSEDYSDIYRVIKRVVNGEVIKDPVIQYAKLFNKFAEDLERNSVVLKLIRKRLAKYPKASILVLSKRRDHAKLLRDFLISHEIPAEVILGGSQSKKQKDHEESVLRAVNAGSIKVLIGTSVADEGLDIPTLNTLILAFPTSWYGITAQRIGRILRNFDGKDIPVVYDLVDADIPDILNSWWTRYKFYRSSDFELDYSEYSGTEILPNKEKLTNDPERIPSAG